MKKRILALLVALCLVVGATVILVACNNFTEVTDETEINKIFESVTSAEGIAEDIGFSGSFEIDASIPKALIGEEGTGNNNIKLNVELALQPVGSDVKVSAKVFGSGTIAGVDLSKSKALIWVEEGIVYIYAESDQAEEPLKIKLPLSSIGDIASATSATTAEPKISDYLRVFKSGEDTFKFEIKEEAKKLLNDTLKTQLQLETDIISNLSASVTISIKDKVIKSLSADINVTAGVKDMPYEGGQTITASATVKLSINAKSGVKATNPINNFNKDDFIDPTVR